jgi:hypothetical protein
MHNRVVLLMERFSLKGLYRSRPPQRFCYYVIAFRARNIPPAGPVLIATNAMSRAL